MRDCLRQADRIEERMLGRIDRQRGVRRTDDDGLSQEVAEIVARSRGATILGGRLVNVRETPVATRPAKPTPRVAIVPRVANKPLPVVKPVAKQVPVPACVPVSAPSPEPVPEPQPLRPVVTVTLVMSVKPVAVPVEAKPVADKSVAQPSFEELFKRFPASKAPIHAVPPAEPSQGRRSPRKLSRGERLKQKFEQGGRRRIANLELRIAELHPDSLGKVGNKRSHRWDMPCWINSLETLRNSVRGTRDFSGLTGLEKFVRDLEGISLRLRLRQRGAGI